MAGFDDTQEDLLHPILASNDFLSKDIPQLSIHDYEYISHAADGGWGSVFKYRCKLDGKLVALKFFGMNGTARPMGKEIENEILKDMDLNHLECCAKLYGYIVDSYTGYVAEKKRYRKEIVQAPPHLIWGKRYKGRYLVKVSECLEKDVMNTLIDNARFGQKAASTVFRNLILGLSEIHRDNMVHRDLKPENFMFVNNNIDRNTDLVHIGVHDLDVKLIDFGSAIHLDPGEVEKTCDGNVGTKLYNAPETCLRKIHSKATDVWQAGVTLWVILFQKYPFSPDASRYSEGKLHFPHHSRVSDNCRDLFNRIFTVDSTKRITCEQILQHSWIRDYASLPDDDFGEDYRNSIKEWVYRKQLRMAIEHEVEKSKHVKTTIEALVANDPSAGNTPLIVSTVQYRQLQKAFVKTTGGHDQMDVESGLHKGVDCPTFCAICSEHGVSQFAKEEIFKAFDLDHSGLVSYYEFLTVLTSFREVVDPDDTHSICKFYFEMFDEDGNEEISREEFYLALKQLLLDYDSMSFEDITLVFDTVDIDGNGAISYEEFKAWFEEVTRHLTSSRQNSSVGAPIRQMNSTESR